MQLQVKKWGNSSAIRLPQAILEQFDMRENDKFDVIIENQSLTLRPSKKGYSISELMAEMPDGLPMIEEWENMPAVGLEKI